jgi:predicted DNA binding CopG/RHH family protein
MTKQHKAMSEAEELAFVEDFESSPNPLVSALTPERRREITAIARATMNDERLKVSLRIPKNDLTRLKSRALQEGIPYQTLINSIIHKYVTS